MKNIKSRTLKSNAPVYGEIVSLTSNYNKINTPRNFQVIFVHRNKNRFHFLAIQFCFASKSKLGAVNKEKAKRGKLAKNLLSL